MSNYQSEYDDIYSANYPFSVRPERNISVYDLMAIHRDWYGSNPWLNNYTFSNSENETKYDLSKGLAAGPFGTPNRFSPGKGES